MTTHDTDRSVTTPDPVAIAIGQATVLLRQALDVLQAHLAACTPEERLHLAPVPDAFAATAYPVLQAVAAVPALAKGCPGFDPDLVQAQLDRVKLVTDLVNKAALLGQLASDAHAVNLAGAYTGLLPVYQVAKLGSRFDTSLREIVLPLERMYDSRKKAPKKTSS